MIEASLDYFLNYQTVWIKDETRTSIAEKSRRIGFTFAESYRSVERRIKLGTDHLFASRSKETSFEFIEYCKMFAQTFGAVAEDLGEAPICRDSDLKGFTIRFANGARIIALSSNPDAFRGFGGDVTLDEFAFHKKQRLVLKAANAAAKIWGHNLRIISTHNGEGSLFNRLIQECRFGKRDPSKWHVHTVTLADAVAQGLVKKITGKDSADDRAAFIADVRDDCIDETEWLEEYCCVPNTDATAYLNYELIDAARTPGLRLIEDPADLTGTIFAGYDVSRRHDLCVLWACELIGDVYTTRMMRVLDGEERKFSTQHKLLDRLMANRFVRRLCPDQTGMGEMLTEYLKDKWHSRVEGVLLSGPSKTAIAAPFKGLFEDRRIRIPDDDDLREDLHKTRKTVTAAGNVRLSADSDDAGHADRFWAGALMLESADDARASPAAIAREKAGGLVMQMPVQIPAVWVYTTIDSYNANRVAGYPDFLTAAQKARLERIRQARLLFDGKHREYFLNEQRTQFDFPPMLAGSSVIQPYFKFNILALISWKQTDLLFGDEPLLKVSDPAQQDAIKALADRSQLHQLFSSKALDGSYEAECFLEAVIFNGQVYLREIPADEIFPLGALQPDGQYPAFVRFQLKNAGSDSTPIYLLLQVTYYPGVITRECWQLDAKGAKLQKLDLAQWQKAADTAPPAPVIPPIDSGPLGYGVYATAAPAIVPAASDPMSQPLAPVTRTGIATNTVTWIPNQLVRGQAVSDYDIGIELQDTLNGKQTQLNRIFAKNSDPKLALPSRMADDQGNARASNDLFYFDSAEEKPSYITWNAECKAAQDDRDFTLYSLLVAEEMSPVLLGLREGSHNDSYKKVRTQAMSPLKKAERKTVFWTAGIKTALASAQAMENALPGTRYDQAPIGVTMQDGIPNDELDEANRLNILTGGKQVMSVRRAVESQGLDAAATEAELEELETENEARAAAATPAILLQAPTGGQENSSESPGAGGGNDDSPESPTSGVTPDQEETAVVAGAKDEEVGL